MNIETVVVGKDDLDTLMPLVVEQQRADGLQVDLDRTRALFEGVVDSGTSYQVMAVEGGGAVGFAMVDAIQNPQLADKVAYLHDVYVTEPSRARGIGAYLLAGGFLEAMRRGFLFAEGETHPDNRPAHRLYDGMAARLGVGVKQLDSVRYLVDLRPAVDRAAADPGYLDRAGDPRLLLAHRGSAPGTVG